MCGPPNCCEQKVCSNSHRELIRGGTTLPLNSFGSKINRCGARRGICIYGHAGPFQAQGEGESPRTNRQSSSSGCKSTLIQFSWHHGPLNVATANIDPAGCVHQGVLSHAHIGGLWTLPCAADRIAEESNDRTFWRNQRVCDGTIRKWT